MKHKRGLLAICIIICLFSIANVSASDINDTVLTSNNDLIENEAISTEILSANPDGTFTDLANEIASATYELNLTRNYVYSKGDSIYQDGIDINKSIAINGNGFTINGNNQAGTFNVKASSVTLNDISFVNEAADGSGIYWTGANGILNNCSFVKFSICWNGDYGILSNCSFINRYSDLSCDAVTWYGANGALIHCSFVTLDNSRRVVDWNGANGTLTHCIFVNATVLWEADNGILSNCSFTNYSDDWRGNGVYWDGDNGVLSNCIFVNATVSWNADNGVLSNCSFTNCTRAIYWHATDGSVANCIFMNCHSIYGSAIGWDSEKGTITNCSFTNCTAEDSGGAISLSYGTSVTITNCSFTNCTAKEYDGGAIYYDDDSTITNCSFTNCTAKRDGGAICSNRISYAIDCTFINNSAEYGGAICSGIVVNSTFINNSAEYGGAMYDGTAVNCTFNYNTAAYYGGAVYDAKVSTSSKFNNNYAPNGKDTYYVTWFDEVDGKTFTDLKNLIEEKSSDIYLNDNYTFDLTSDYNLLKGINVDHAVTVHGNGHTINGNNMARIFNVDAKNVVFKDMIFVNASADFGGAIYNGIAVNCTFINNSAEQSDGGGAIYNGVAVNCTFINNSAEYGGALRSGSAVNCTFNYNTAAYYGGAVYDAKVSTSSKFNNNYAPNGKDTYYVTWFDEVDGKTFTDLKNLIDESSSDIYLNDNYTFDLISDYDLLEGINVDHAVTVHGNGHTINGNNMARIFNVDAKEVIFKDTLFVNALSSGSGGAINGQIFAVNCTFINNSAEEDGGAIYNGSAVNSIFINNSAEYGGALHSGSVVTCTFINNSAEEDGGAIYNGSAVNSIFINNSAEYGGALHSGSAVNCTFISNSAVGFWANGGAIYDGSAVNCTFISNSAVGFWANGGAMYLGSAVNCTFTNNHAHIYGGATFYSKVINCIFKGKSAGEGDNDVYPILATVLTVRYDNTTKNIAATVKDANGNPVSGIKVGFACNGVKYVLTDVNGQALFSTSSLAGGSNTVKIMAYGNEAYKNSNQETVTVTKEQAKIYLRNALYFVLQTKYVTVTLWDANNRPIANKTVYIRLYDNDWKYSGVTDENGNALIRVGVGFGNHPVTVSFEGDDIYGSCSKTGRVRVIKETPSLMLPGAYTKFKASEPTKTIKVYLKDRYNKPLLPGTKVFVTINGHQYVGLIDNEGIASININLNKAGVYNVDLYYTGNTAYNAVRKTTKITIV